MADTAFAYLDESGDLGWKLDLPYLDGGASRYFIVAAAVGFNNGHRRIGKVIDKLRQVQKWTSRNEKKWATISTGARTNFCQIAAKELSENSEIKVLLSVYHKNNAPKFLRSVDVRIRYPGKTEDEYQKLSTRYKGRAHLIYAMLVAETFARHLPFVDRFAYCPDDLNEGQRTLDTILTYRLLLQDKRSMEINKIDRAKPMQSGLDFADMCAGAVFEAYQNGNTRFLDILKPYVVIREYASSATTTADSFDS